MNSRIISVKVLAPVHSTRERGNEAYRKLAESLSDPLTVDLDGPSVLTPSFLDGIILRLKENQQTQLVSFRTTDQGRIASLRRICNLRDTAYTESEGDFILI